MRIAQLDLERYGLFEDRRLVFDPDAALHVVFGGNEAGKTSALSAVGDLLFGFGARTDYDFRHEAKTLRIGGQFHHSDGRVIAVRRRKGNKRTLVDDDDRPLPDETLAPLLGGVSREVFSREFGLTAQALRDGGHALLGAGGRLAETLAATSAGMSALSRRQARLQQEADELFTPRRSAGKPFYVAMERRETADRSLREAIVTRDAIRQAEAAAQTAREQLDRLNADHAELDGLLAHWRRALRARSALDRLDAIAAGLAGLSDVPTMAPQVLSELRAAYEAHDRLGEEVAALDDGDTADAAEIAALAIDEAVLASAPRIDALRERLGAVRKAQEDLPRRRQARDDAQAALGDLGRQLGLSSHADLLGRLPTEPALARARDLIRQVQAADAAITEVDRRCARARQDRVDLADTETPAFVADIPRLRQRFAAFADVPSIVERHRRATSAFEAETANLVADLDALDPPPGDPETLAALPLPDAHVIAQHAQAHDAGAAEGRRLDELIEAADTAIAATEGELARLLHTGRAPTRAELSEARRDRDAALSRLREALDGAREPRLSGFEAVRRSIETIDSLTDRLLGDTERATRQEDARQRLAAHRNERDRLAAKRARSREIQEESERAWRAAWRPAGLVPRAPAAMLRWRERVDDLRARIRKRDAQRAEIDALAKALQAGRQAILVFLEEIGPAPDSRLAADILFRETKGRLDELDAAWAERRSRAVARQRAERDLADAVAEREAAGSRRDALRAQWPAAMAGIGQPAAASPAEAQAALDVWQQVPVREVSFRREGRSVETIEADLRTFAGEVADVAQRAAPGRGEREAQDALARLVEALTQARRAHDVSRRLQAQVSRRAAARQSLAIKRDGVATTLDVARQQFGIADIDALRHLLDRVETMHRLESDQAAIRRDLAEIADGRDEQTLRREREGLDLGLLAGEIERAEVRRRQLLTEIEDASVAHHQARQALEALMAGRDAALAAAECADANAELLSIAESWLVRAVASKLAARAIERYRAKVQDPLVTRAGELFATATGNVFGGLRVDYGKDDQPVLVAERRDGERVPIEGLSEGTRDQLFLALRLALLERWPSEPLPFIGDDLLTSFDDERTAAALRLLAGAGERRQIILFTHHRRVVELADAVGNIDVVTL